MNTLEFCEKYLKNYTINQDYTVDVNGNVDIYLGDMKKLPLQFGKVFGYFNIRNNKLTTLKGCPNYVIGYFSCYNSVNLKSLEGCPNYVGGGFICSSNKLTSLEYCPKHIGESFICDTLTHHVLGNVGNYIFSGNDRIVI
jgi:hypothetical protein